VTLVLAGCSSNSGGPKVAAISSGQIPRSAVVLGATGGKSAAADVATTVPLAKQDPTTAFFSSLAIFQSCLKGLGVTFSGAPSATNSNPQYIKSLTTCAAQSNIVQALKAEQTAQQNLTQKQIAVENKDYLHFRTCMIARGWIIPVPKPDADGALFSFGTSGSSVQMTPPPGQSLLSNPDIQACAALAQRGKS